MNRLFRIASRFKLRLTLVVALVLALVSAVGAFGYFTSAGAGTDSASTGTLNPPTNVTVPTSSTGTVHVAWTASVTGPSAIAPTGYYVERNAGGPAWATACDSSLSALVSATDCDDTGSADGDYTYRVTAVYHSWTATGGMSSSVHLVTDSTPPTSTIGFPGAGPHRKSGWNAGCATPGTGDICGTANDPGAGATGVARVQVAIQRLSDGDYWIGGGWSSAPVWNDATGTTSWSYPLGTGDFDDGVSYTIRSRAIDNAGNTQTTPDSKTFGYDSTAPSVTVEQNTGQSDPTNSLPLRWAVSFTEPVTGFDTSDVTRSGTATGGAVTVTGSDASYEISLDGNPTNGTVSFTIGANRAQDAAGNGNTASTSMDDTIAYDTVAPFVKLQQKAGQADPTNSLPIRFTVQFGEPVADFDASDVSLGGTAGGGSVSVTGSGGEIYEIVVSGLSSDGTVTASVGAGKAHDAAGNASSASASVDNAVAYDATAPSVAVEQGAGQADPTSVLPLRWAVTFNEPVAGFDAGDLTRSGTSTGGTVDVTGSGASYEIALTGTPTNGTVSFSIDADRAQDVAGNGNTASTSRDDTVVYDTVTPETTIAFSPASSSRTNAWYGSAAPTFTLSASDANSGAASTLYAIDGGSAEAYGGAVTVFRLAQ